ncbi:hypothetical protein PVAND_008748 [Polypedilum vanderplanki]|uniref:Peptidase S1 domain-containing protein n=1 Tax=Polypedilum vanderplanki TaxID=319348 RepID=A0A9J6CB72_POLVA|nr:hypothetical protein PVAND_008748 [Polypedilum vanderplanki]
MHSLGITLLLFNLFFFTSSFSNFNIKNKEILAQKPKFESKKLIESFRKKGRITNGFIANNGSNFLPFFTLLYVRKVTNIYNMCAGSIISEKFLISAGHCFESSAEVFILAGFNNSNLESYTFFDQVASKNVIVHPSYNSTTISNDIALIKFSQNIIFNLVLQKIKLPLTNSNFMNKSGIVSGFGIFSDVNATTSNVLRYTFVTVINGSTCNLSYGSNFFSNDRQLCIDTKSGHSSTCSGDSGASLGIFENNILTLAGIVSYGSTQGCELGNPEVYTKVSSYLQWIGNKTGIVVL